MRVHCICKHTYKRAHKHIQCNMCRHTHTDTHYGFCRDSKENICFESITSLIFIFLSPCCYNFLPCQTNQNTKTKRRLRQRLRFSTVRFTGTLLSQTSSVQRDLTCVFVHPCTVTVHVSVCVGGWVRWSCVDFQVSENTIVNSV